MPLSTALIRMATSGLGVRHSSQCPCVRRLQIAFRIFLVAGRHCLPPRCSKFLTPYQCGLWNPFPVQLKMGPGSTVSLIGQLHLRGLRMSSNHCDKIFTISSCSAGRRHACVRLSQISARTPCLQHLKWLTSAHCGSNGPRHRATQVPSTGRSLQVSLMPLRHGRDWQVCLRIGM